LIASSASMLQWSFTGGSDRCFAISLKNTASKPVTVRNSQMI
jgi:hypothetical protein